MEKQNDEAKNYSPVNFEKENMKEIVRSPTQEDKKESINAEEKKRKKWKKIRSKKSLQ